MKDPTGYTGVGWGGHMQGVSQAGREEGLPEEVKFKQKLEVEQVHFKQRLKMALLCRGNERPDRCRGVSQETVEVQSKKRQTWETGFQCTGKSWRSHSAEGADLD